MQEQVTFTIDSRAAREQLAAAFALMPEAARRANNRALKRVGTWMKRQALRCLALGAGTTQKAFAGTLRIKFTESEAGFVLWLGTNDVSVHRLGRVAWRPYVGAGSRPKSHPKRPSPMAGARVGRRVFPGSWSWPTGKTAGLVMHRVGGLTATGRPKIASEKLPIHAQVMALMPNLEAEAGRRYERELTRQLDYALNHENR